MKRHGRPSYGILWVGRRPVLAHRLLFVIQAHAGLPAGAQLNHACNAVDCVRSGPGHVYRGTQAQNMDDKVLAGRARGGSRPGELNRLARLNTSSVLAIRTRAAAGDRQEDIARDFLVSRETVNAVAFGRRWVHVLGPRTHRRLAPSALRILILRASGKKTWPQVAAELGFPLGTVHAALYRRKPPRASRRALAQPLDPSLPRSIAPAIPSAPPALDILAAWAKRNGGWFRGRPAA